MAEPGSSYDHRIRLLEPHQRSTKKCGASALCGNPPTHKISYRYFTGYRRTTSAAGRYFCSGHAAQFAQKNDIEYIGPPPCSIDPTTRKPLIQCVVCGHLRRDPWEVPQGLEVFQPLRTLADAETPTLIQPGSFVDIHCRVRVREDVAAGFISPASAYRGFVSMFVSQLKTELELMAVASVTK